MSVAGSDNFADAPILPLGTFSLPTDPTGFTAQPGEPPGRDESAWWKFVVTSSTETYRIQLQDTGSQPYAYDPVVNIFQGTSLTDLVHIQEADDSDGSYVPAPIIRTFEPGVYYLRLTHYTGSVGPYVVGLHRMIEEPGPWLDPEPYTLRWSQTATGKQLRIATRFQQSAGFNQNSEAVLQAGVARVLSEAQGPFNTWPSDSHSQVVTAIDCEVYAGNQAAHGFSFHRQYNAQRGFNDHAVQAPGPQSVEAVTFPDGAVRIEYESDTFTASGPPRLVHFINSQSYDGTTSNVLNALRTVHAHMRVSHAGQEIAVHTYEVTGNSKNFYNYVEHETPLNLDPGDVVGLDFYLTAPDAEVVDYNPTINGRSGYVRWHMDWQTWLNLDVLPPRHRFIYVAPEVAALTRVRTPGRLTGRSDGLGPLGGPRRLDTTSASQQSGFHPGSAGSYY